MMELPSYVRFLAELPSYVQAYQSPSVANTLVGTPRFGHTSDISVAIGGGPEATDYAAGLIFGAAITGTCFLFFMLSIVILKCFGRERVGFLSGKPFRQLYADQYSTENEDEQSSRYSFTTPNEQVPPLPTNTKSKDGCCGNSTPIWIRGTFVISGILFILFGILIVTQGITNLQDTVLTVHQSSVDIGSISVEAEDIISKGLTDIRGLAESVRDSLRQELSGSNFCPADPTLQNNTSAKDIRDKADSALEMLDKLDDFMQGDVENVSKALEQVQKQAVQIENDTENVDLTGWTALLILIPYTLVPCLLVAAAIMAHFDVEFPVLTCTINWFLMPLFILMVVVCAGVATSMIGVASANADFCLPGDRPQDSYPGTSPDTTVYRMLDVQGFTVQTEFVRQVANYYVEQCQNVTDPFKFMTDYLPQLYDSQKTLKDLADDIQGNGTLEELAVYCNREFDDLDALLTEMETVVDAFLDAVKRALGLVACDRIVPIYHLAIYDGACQYSVSAVFWVFSSALIMGTFGLLMILFRASYKLTVYDADDLGLTVVPEQPRDSCDATLY